MGAWVCLDTCVFVPALAGPQVAGQNATPCSASRAKPSSHMRNTCRRVLRHAACSEPDSGHLLSSFFGRENSTLALTPHWTRRAPGSSCDLTLIAH